MSLVFQPRKFCAAAAIMSGVVPILAFTTASAFTLIKSSVGTKSEVTTSTLNCSMSR